MQPLQTQEQIIQKLQESYKDEKKMLVIHDNLLEIDDNLLVQTFDYLVNDYNDELGVLDRNIYNSLAKASLKSYIPKAIFKKVIQLKLKKENYGIHI